MDARCDFAAAVLPDRFLAAVITEQTCNSIKWLGVRSNLGLPSKLLRMKDARGRRTQRSEVRLPRAAASE
jgi:uncharacterized membrane protein